MMGIPEPSKAEIAQEMSSKEHCAGKRLLHSFQWLVAALAAISLVALGFWGLKRLYEFKKSGAFYSQAKAILEQGWAGTSPSNLRLALPFSSISANRSDAGPESLRRAETLLYQALVFRENMAEAHLGLACIYLNESNPARARDEFQKVLDIRKGHLQALIGHGVAQYEEATRGSDPVQRGNLLAGALRDFNAALQRAPGSSEARYDKVWTLFDSGSHTEALEEIERYLSRDPGSVWAEGLRGLRAGMRATQISAVEENIRRYARERDRAALLELARQAPYQVPAAILSAMRQSLEHDPTRAAPGGPNSEDLRWAAETMETAYSASTGDTSFRALLAFYLGLSPHQRALKRALDKRFQDLDELYRAGKFAIVLRGSKPLERRYATLRDLWQLADLHHLRGNSYYLGQADFDAAAAEFRKMLEIAGRLNMPELKAKAMVSLAMIYDMQRKFDDSLSYANSLKDLAQSYGLESWQIYACMTLGNQFRRIGQFEQSLHEYAAALGMAYRLLDAMKIIEILENLGVVMDRLERIQEARAFYSQALQQQESFLSSRVLQASPEVAIRRLNLLFSQGELALRTGDFAAAEALFRESLKSTPSGMCELEGRNRIGLAETYLSTNRVREAEAMLESAVALSAAGQYPEIEWQAQSIKGRLLERTGHHQEALLSLRQAIEILEGMRSNIRFEDLRQSFLTDRFDPFKRMVSLLYESAEDNRKTLEFVDRAKSITLRENLRMQELASKGPENSTALAEKENAYPIVEYFFTHDGLLIFSTSGAHTEAVAQAVSQEELSRQIKDYLESIRRNDATSFGKRARRLYDELIAPVEKHVFADPSKTLVILPDGPLHLLPFAGLEDRQGRYLIEKAPLAFAPSRSVFRHCLLLSRRSAAENPSATLIDGSANLSSAQEELVYIARLYGRNALILAPKDLPLFRQAVSGSGIVHFSGHAITIQGRPALLLQTSPAEIYLDCPTISTWKMPRAILVNLAGCSTGIGPLSEGEAPWGLIPAFLNAGAPAIIASLMPVDDASTKRLSCRFYDLLRKGASKAEALQKAQLSLLASARSASDIRPQSWIPYILVGNPR